MGLRVLINLRHRLVMKANKKVADLAQRSNPKKVFLAISLKGRGQKGDKNQHILIWFKDPFGKRLCR